MKYYLLLLFLITNRILFAQSFHFISETEDTKIDTSGITDIGFDGKYPKYIGNPVLGRGIAGRFDDQGVVDPSIVKTGDSSYVMIYVGQPSTFYTPRLGRAVSSDGLNWVKTDSVFSPQSNGGSGLKNRYQWEGRTIYDNDTLKMWYQAADTTNYVFQTFYAYSLDTGKTWTRYSNNPVFGVDAGNAGWAANYAGFRSVIKKDSSYYAFFEGRGTESESFGIGSAISPNGKDWINLSPSSPVIKSNESWNTGQSLLPTVFLQGNKFVCFYSINNIDTTQTGKTGYAVSYDGITWYKNASNPVTNLRSSHGEWDNGYLVGVMQILKTSTVDNNYIMYYRAGAHSGGALFKIGAIILNELPLPVELSSFSSILIDRNVELNWSTKSEFNNKEFMIERKLYGQSDWIKLGQVPGHGNSNISNNYNYFDYNLNSGNYNYRLKQIDYNGNYKYFNLSNNVLINLPVKFSLYQNYPNPFNSTTKIKYDLPIASKVELKLFDGLGREMNVLINSFQNAGYYEINYNASNLASGVYYYQLTAMSNFNYLKTMKFIYSK